MAVKTLDFFEPWFTTKGTGHGEKPSPEGYPEGVGEAIVDVWRRADESAPWFIWGSRMSEPAICVGLTGKTVVTEGVRVIAIERSLGLPEGTPGHSEFAKRIADCVSAMAGVRDPGKFVEDVRKLLVGYIQGECDDPRRDNRVVSLLSRCVPTEQFEFLQYDEEERS